MKRISILVVMLVVSSTYTYSQWNPAGATTGSIYYTGGNVGVGASSPQINFEVVGFGQIIRNTFASGYTTIRLYNDKNISNRALEIDYAGSTYPGSLLINGPSGESGAISTIGNYPLAFGTNNTYRMMIAGDGKVGIGTTYPQAKLDVGGVLDGGNLGTVFGRLGEGNSTGNGTFLGVRGYDTQPTNAKSFAIEHNFYGMVNSSINFNRGGGMSGGFITFNTNDNTESVRITTLGNVGIGTTDPKSFKLAVNGKVWATEVQVAINNPGPDYVFEETYKLPSLADTETYIKQNKHLPEVPSACEMEENGINLSEMNMILLKKVEELTLYVIELKKRDELQEQQNNLLRKEMETLKTQVNERN